METLLFTNVETGIKDRSVFDLPSTCDDVPVTTVSNQLTLDI